MESLIEKTLSIDLPKRSSISIPKSVNFGLEIENNGLESRDEWDNVKRIITNIDNRLLIHDDDSLNYTNKQKKETFGIEISTPVMQNKKEDLVLLKKISKTLKFINPKYDLSSFQINYDDNLTINEKLELLKVYAHYEKILMRFCRGNDEYLRDCTCLYSHYIYYELLGEIQNE